MSHDDVESEHGGVDDIGSLTAARATDQTPRLMLAAGALYFGAILFRDWILGVLGIPSVASPDYVRQFAAVHVLASFALRVPALAVILFIFVRYPGSRLRASLAPEPARVVMWTIVVTVAVTFLLNLFGVWPFMWRWASDSTSTYAGILVSSERWFAILLWMVTAVVIGPVIEELVFRFGVLQSVRDWTGSLRKAVISSSAVFALGHLGYLPPDLPHTVNASWLFAASLLLGWITLRRSGRLGVTLTAHATRNALEQVLLFLLARPGAS